MDLLLHELGRNLGNSLRTPFRPAIVDRHGVTVSPTEFAQSIGKSSAQCGIGRNGKPHERDGRPLARLLRPRRKRPDGYRAADERDELTPPCMSRKQHIEG